MTYITIDDCLDQIPNRFELTLCAACRARQIANGAISQIDNPNAKNKPAVLALRELAAGRISRDILYRNRI